MTRTLTPFWKAVLGEVSARLAVDGRLPYWRYRLILGQVPIICVDVLPVRRTDGRYEAGLIKREDENGDLRWAMIGGGVYRGETLAIALERHVKDTLGEHAAIELLADEAFPQAVGQYFPNGRSGFGHDPRKHAVALSYWAILSGETTAMGEAKAFEWFDLAEMPAAWEFGYGHEMTVARLVKSLP